MQGEWDRSLFPPRNFYKSFGEICLPSRMLRGGFGWPNPGRYMPLHLDWQMPLHECHDTHNSGQTSMTHQQKGVI